LRVSRLATKVEGVDRVSRRIPSRRVEPPGTPSRENLERRRIKMV
jgi:hypothetical protein